MYVEIAVSKVEKDLINTCKDTKLITSIIEEMALFDAELRSLQSQDQPRTSCSEILFSRKGSIDVWIDYEERAALSTLQNVIQADAAFRIKNKNALRLEIAVFSQFISLLRSLFRKTCLLTL